MPLIVGPAAEPVTLDEVKQNLKIDSDITDHDDVLTGMIAAARVQAEQITGRRFGSQTWELLLSGFPVGTAPILLPDAPVVSIASISYTASDRSAQSLAPEAVFASLSDDAAALVPLSAWPAALGMPGAVRIRYTCGLQASDARWPLLQRWMHAVIASWFEPETTQVQTFAPAPTSLARLLDALIRYDPSTTD